MPRCDLTMSVDPARDDFLLWLRWVAMESPPTPSNPPGQGIRFELQFNRHRVLGPQIVRRAEIPAQGLCLPVPRCGWRGIIATRPAPKYLDLQLVLHGSVANAPFMALYHLRDAELESAEALRAQDYGTPLLQLSPSVPAGQWQVAGQANLRVALRLVAPGGHLPVLQDA